MLSRLTIEVDFSNGNIPCIQILQENSDDVRDKLVSQFLQSLMHTSRWCRIEYIGEQRLAHRWSITPITPYDLQSEIKLMEAVIQEKQISQTPL